MKEEKTCRTQGEIQEREVQSIISNISSARERRQYTSMDWTDEGVSSNAVEILKHFRPGVNHLVDVLFVVEGQILRSYKSFELNQSIKTHHEITLELSHDALKGIETHEMQQAQNLLLGEKVKL